MLIASWVSYVGLCLGGVKVDGCWKLIYSTISILGKKRTKLGLRDFISLGDFLQIIDVKEVSEGYRTCGIVMLTVL